MAVNDVKTWIGSIGPYLSDSSKAVSGLQTDKEPVDANDAVTSGYVPAQVAKAINEATNKTTPVDADKFPIIDSAASWGLRSVTWANIKATAKAYFDTIYVNSVGATAPVTSTGGVAPVIAIPAATASADGYMSSAYATKIDAITAAALTVLDDATVAAMVDTLGGAASTGTGGLVRNTSPTFTTQISTPKIVTASGNLEITPAGDANVILQGSGTGNVGIGFTAPETKLHIINEVLGEYVAIFSDHTADTTGATLKLLKSRGTYASPSAVLSGDKLGAIDFYSRGASTYAESAAINVVASQNHSETARGCYVEIKTTADGSITPATAVYIGQNKYVGIGTTSPNSPLHIEMLNHSSGNGAYINLTQTTSNPTDTYDSVMRFVYKLDAVSAINELVSRGLQYSFTNNLTGGGILSNLRMINTAITTQTGSTIDQLDQIYVENGTTSGTVNNHRFLRIVTMQGTKQAGISINQLNSGTSHSLILLGTNTIPTGNFGIYNSSSYNNYLAGNVGIGTTTPQSKLQILGTSGAVSTYGIMSFDTDTGTNDMGVKIGAVAGAGSAGYVFIQSKHTGVANDGNLLLNPTAGNVGIGMTPNVQFELSGSVGQKASGTTWSNPSDARLKNIQGPADLQRCYDDVKALPLLRYTLKSDCITPAQAADRTVTGFTANDVQKVIPKAVNVVPFSKVPVLDGVEEYQEDVKNADGTVETVTKTRPKYITEVIEDCLNLDMSQVYMQMFGAVQMLQLKVDALQAEIAILRKGCGKNINEV